MITELKPIFVNSLPADKDMVDGEHYIAMQYRLSSHRCCCGCGEKVILIFSKDNWNLTYNSKVSITPSVGNYSFPCKSHYFITDNKVVWC